ncbi:MAG: hypothetical protein WCK51_00790 [Armatimonadota bacterium]
MKPSVALREVLAEEGFSVKTERKDLTLEFLLQKHPQESLWNLSLDIKSPTLWELLGRELEAKVDIPVANYSLNCHADEKWRSGVYMGPDFDIEFKKYAKLCISKYFGPCIVASRDVASFVRYATLHPYILGRSSAKTTEVLAIWDSIKF